jgi:LacI family transcriptional regulator
MKTTIADVARMANVSKAAVSAVLNDRPGISKETREKILQVIQRLNYKPNAIARSLIVNRTKSIGLVIKEIDNPYFSKIMKGVFDACSKLGYTVLLGSSELSPGQERKSVEALTGQRVDGLILSPLQGEDVDFSYLADLIRDGIPVATLGSVKNYATNVVDIDNADAACRAVTHLIGLGHTDIAYFAGPAYSAHSDERLEGYRKAHMEHNLQIREKNIIRVGSYVMDSFKSAKAFLSGPVDRPTAVFCYNDLVAIGLINALFEMEIPVPDRMSVLGFDDLEAGEYFKIPLTTVHVPAYEIGYAAAELLIRQLNASEPAPPQKILFPTKIVVRNSCAVKTAVPGREGN